jgi:formate C-acetyltransferase
MDDVAVKVKEPYNLSPRIKWLRDYYFLGNERTWRNDRLSFTTNTPWDSFLDEVTFYITPDQYPSFALLETSYRLSARPVPLPEGFWDQSIPERRAWFNREVMVNHMPKEVLPGDLICGGRFNMMTSRCLNEQESKAAWGMVLGDEGTRASVINYHAQGFGNLGATSGHLVPGYGDALRKGFSGIKAELAGYYDALSEEEKAGKPGAQLRAMQTAADIAGSLTAKYADLCASLVETETDEQRKAELLEMERICRKVPEQPPETFWEAVQALWITHMLILADENYPGPGVSWGRIDQYLLPYYEKSVQDGVDREFMKDILKCFFIHCNTAYDFWIIGGNQGINAGFGQLMTLSGMGPDGRDMTNDLTWLFLEAIDEMYPILEPKPNVRLHKGSPPELIEKVADMIASCQGAPFLLNFDERSIAGMLREAREAGIEDLINESNVFDYAPVGCLENTMVGNDRSGTVDVNVNLTKGIELTLGNGCSIAEFYDAMGAPYTLGQEGPQTGDPASFSTFEEFYQAFIKQIRHILDKTTSIYNMTDTVRGTWLPTPYLSLLVKNCAEKAKDITEGGAQIRMVTVEGVAFATTVDSLLAVKYLVYDEKVCTMEELIEAVKANWQGYDVLRAQAINRAPKYGRDNDEADELARRFMQEWSSMVWDYRTPVSDAQFRGGMLSWNYWVSDAAIVPATPDGRIRGQFLSNAICPSNGADINGPTANINSVGKVLGGKAAPGEQGDFQDYVNYLPNGASHTITLSPSIVRNAENKKKFEALLKGYIANGGTALQVNILDVDMLKDAQAKPQEYKHLLVRVTGYNAYFTSVGKELQDEIIAREMHKQF